VSLEAVILLPEHHGAILAVGVRSFQPGPVPCALFFLFGSSHFGEFINQALRLCLVFGFGLRLPGHLALF
jgi:hypothetical protein